MSTETGKLNSNPEILLKKRKNADRLRIEKQQQSKRRQEALKKKKQDKKAKFIRAETLVSKKRASELEKTRIKRVSQYDRLHENDDDEKKTNDSADNEGRLLFVVRIKGPHGARIPSKALKVLSVLRLNHINMGTFVKLNSTVRPLLRLINPYIVVGTPSLSTVRNLIQKRATVKIADEEFEEGFKIAALDDNSLIEDKLGDDGVICTEDIIHEIISLGEAFKPCVKFMEPFKLNSPVNGWGPLNKLKRIQLQEEAKNYKVSNAGNAKLNEVDIDKFIAEQI